MKKINSKTFYNLIFGLFILAILAKVYQYTCMKDYSFGIMTKLLNWINTDYIPEDNSYAFPLRIYRCIKFFGFSTNLQWSIFWVVVMNIVFFIMLIRHKDKYSVQETIFIYASMFILDVFVFNLNKDLVQAIIVLILYGIIKSLKIKNSTKLILSILVFIFESIYFRPYYILIAGLLFLNYFIFKGFNNKSNNITKKKVILTICMMLILMFAGIFATQYIVPDSYNQLVHRRDNLENDVDANTLITDWISGDSFIIYCVNYVINFIRICFPIELLFKGKFYIIFVIYQIYLTINMIIGMKHLDKNSICYKSFLLAYWMTMVASESDFGTLVRHQSILFMFYMMLINDNMKLKRMNKENEKN